ncbi:hypothetical protein Lesp02_20170 [Lentzea sp. NBRC 105346]|uniref:hypothetical protein n=1 Tax=Lentzea sp. NBRC 105346 TaxID=3032205 RepID=UPI0024A25A22|nr:hypothetical protein [Lentzea sp. NBRC 105346]GLZ29827.1 hypothetical protein Lesp02_20170 [Lentzea sp. NBRC 105346]
MPELTPHEKELLAGPDDRRGYTPRDGVEEPAAAPKDPASASQPAESDQSPT